VWKQGVLVGKEIFAKYIVLGAGPAGLQMGYFLHQRNRDYLILEKQNTAGSFFARQPVHRNLLSINKKYNYFTEEEFNWRHDWNSLLSDDPEMRFTRYSDDLFPHADTLYQYLQDFSKHFDLNINYQTRITRITRNSDQEFCLTTEKGPQYRCKVLLLGLGAVGPSIPDEIEGIELATGYGEQSLDLDSYRNKRVGIIGQGNSAFETAEYLSGVACYVHIFTDSPVKLAWETHFVGDVRAVNNNIFDMYQLKSMHAVLSPRIRKIEKISDGVLRTSHEYDYPAAEPPGTLKLTREYDYIIYCTGFRFVDPGLFDEKHRPAISKDGRYPVLNSSWECANLPDLYFIGTTMSANDKQSASGFIHGYRYNIRTLFNLLEEKHEKISYPCEPMIPFRLDDFLDWMYTRFSTSAGLFQLYGFLCDVLVFSEDLNNAKLYSELPVEYARETLLNSQPVFVFTLEFGFDKFKESSITFMGPSNPVDSSCAAFLHPVIRYYRGEDIDEFHFADSLLGRWDRPHDEGGAVMSNHYAFLKWLERKLGTDFNLSAPSDSGAYHVWSEEEKEEWRNNQITSERDYECERPN
jgi:thioredoxin reductase